VQSLGSFGAFSCGSAALACIADHLTRYSTALHPLSTSQQSTAALRASERSPIPIPSSSIPLASSQHIPMACLPSPDSIAAVVRMHCIALVHRSSIERTAARAEQSKGSGRLC